MHWARIRWWITPCPFIVKTTMSSSRRRNLLLILPWNTIHWVITLHEIYLIYRVADIISGQSVFSIISSQVIKLMEMIRTMHNWVTRVISSWNTCAFLFWMKIVIACLSIVTCASTISLIILRTQSAETSSSSSILTTSWMNVVLIIY